MTAEDQRDAGCLEEVVFTDATGKQRSPVHLWTHPHDQERLQWAGLVIWNDEWKTWRAYTKNLGVKVFRRNSGKMRRSPTPDRSSWIY